MRYLFFILSLVFVIQPINAASNYSDPHGDDYCIPCESVVNVGQCTEATHGSCRHSGRRSTCVITLKSGAVVTIHPPIMIGAEICLHDGWRLRSHISSSHFNSHRQCSN